MVVVQTVVVVWVVVAVKEVVVEVVSLWVLVVLRVVVAV